ncbi:MAG TPA: NTP transferase domain-containing protein, partial [Chthonomonadales bacterium]|nr:NTP transferase domain-containing protein [Chthonomonadales bacterium]
MESAGLILAAGRGRRFWPFQEIRSKCAFPICNVPVVLRIACQMRELGLQRILVGVPAGSQAQSLRAALQPAPWAEVVEETEAAGTSRSVLNLAALSGDATRFLVAYGDCVFSTADLRRTWSALGEHITAAALCAELNEERPQDWICCLPGPEDTQGNVDCLSVEGHPRQGTHRLAGVFALDGAALTFLERVPPAMAHVPVGGMPAQEQELADGLAFLLEAGHRVACAIAQDRCADIDKPWHILQATDAALLELAAQMPSNGAIHPTAFISDRASVNGPIVMQQNASIGDGVSISGPCWLGPRSKVLRGAIVGARTVIGPDSRVSDYCLIGEGSVVGAGCIVGHGAEFEGVMLDGAYLYHYCEIAGVVGTKVDIGAATVCGTLRFDDVDTVHRINGRREVPHTGANWAYFGDYSRTGVNVI